MDLELIKSIMENNLTIDCPKITLTPHSPISLSRIHQGSGFIGQQQDGSISLKMYCSGEVSPEEVLYPFKTTAGAIIEDQYYYRLSAKDIIGRDWESKWIFPSIQSGNETSGYVINANITEITYISKLTIDPKAQYAWIYFPGDIKIPFNTGTKTHKIVKGENRSTSSILNLSCVKSCGFEFEIEKESNWLTLNALSTSKKINDTLVMRFTEALQFVLARSLAWSAVELINGDMRKVRVRSCRRNDKSSRVHPPIYFNMVDPYNNIWKLFDIFLLHIIDYKEERWHPVFNWIHAIIESGSSSVNTEALVLSVAIEGVLGEEFTNVKLNSEQLTEEVKKAKWVITQSDLNPDFKKRLQGSLNAMLKPRAKDILHFLKQKGLIKSELIKEYEKLRDKAAHGGTADVSRLQEHLDRCAAVLTLFYQLIFLAIGYTGQYTDYSKRGFPAQQFDKILE